MRSRILIIVFFVKCLLGLSVAFAHTEIEMNGLLNHKISCIVKDRNGLIWVGTMGGVQNFDGYRFSQVCYLRNYEVTALAEDRLGNKLWIGTTRGLFYYDFNTGTVEECTPYSLFYTNTDEGTSCIPYSELKHVEHILTGNGNVYVSFHREPYLLRIDPDGAKKLVPGTHFENQSLKKTSKALFAAGGKLFYIAGKEVIEFDERSLKSASHGVWNIGRSCSFVRVNGQLLFYVDYKEQLQAYDYKRRCKISHPLNGMDAFYVMGTGGDVFFMSHDKLSVWYEGDTTIKTLYNDPISGNLMSLFVDETPIVWLGTRKGLVKITEKKPPSMQSILQGTSTRQIVSDSAYLYIAGYSGLIRYAKDKSLAKSDSLLSPLYTRSLYYDTASGYLYVGSEANSPHNLLRYNLQTGVMEKDFYKGPLLRHYIFSIVKDPYHTFWIGTAEGLYSLRKGEVKYVRNVDPDYIKYLSLAANGNDLIVSGVNKISIVDVRNGSVRKAALPHSEGISEVYYAAEGMDGNIWVGTNASGLLVLSPDLLPIKHFTTSDGLPNDCINSIIWENAHKLWISTNQGVCLYNLGTGKFITYHLEDGIADEEFNQNSFLKDSDGRFYFGGINGITTFRPDRVHLDHKTFNVFASNIEKWGESKRYTLNGQQDEYILEPGDYYLTFTFGTNDYSTPEKTRFYYRIKGIHDEWRLMRENNTLVIDRLNSGKYIVEVKAINKNGMVSSNKLQYVIIYRPVFYETAWFSLLILLIICGGMYLYFASRLRMIRRLQDIRTQIASHLHDEVGGILTSISMMSEQLAGSRKPADEIKLKRIAELSRDATLSMSDVLWSIDGRNDSTRNLADRMKEQAEDMLLPKGIQLFFDFPSQHDIYALQPEDRQNFFLIFKEALNNILKHSAATYVKIRYNYQRGNFLLEIENDGVAHFNRDKSGQGLRNIEMRARMLGAEATIEYYNHRVRIMVK